MNTNSSTPFQVVRGTEDEIKHISYIEEGTLYFSTDTKRIYYGSKEHTLISMGGNSGFAYGTYSDLSIDELSPEFVDPLNFDTDEPIGLNEGDLILNSNGGFYKIVSISKEGDNYIYGTNRITVTGGSGGGGGSSSGVNIILSASPSRQNILVGEKVYIDFSYSATYNNGLTVNADPWFEIVVGPDEVTRLSNITLTDKNSITVRLEDRTENGYDITPLTPVLTSASNRKVYIKAYVDTGKDEPSTQQTSVFINYTPASGIWSILASAENSTLTHNTTEDFNSYYIFSHNNLLYHYYVFYINGDAIYTSSIRDYDGVSGTSWDFTIPNEVIRQNYSHGFYSLKFEIYASLTDEPETFKNIRVQEGFILNYDPNNTDLIIGSTLTNFQKKQYEVFDIPVMIFSSKNSENNFELILRDQSNDSPIENIENLKWYSFFYTPIKAGEINLFVLVPGQGQRAFLFNIQPLDLGDWKSSGTESLLFNFDPRSFTGNQSFDYDNFSLSENFDFKNGGYRTETVEVNGQKTRQSYFRIKAGNELTIPKSLFSLINGNNNTSVSDQGRCFKIIFRITNSEAFDASFGKFNSSGANFINFTSQYTEYNLGGVTGTVQYYEDSLIEMEIDVSSQSEYSYIERTSPKTPESTSTSHPYLICWVDGMPYSAKQMKAVNINFDSTITLGSNECDVDIYLIKGYTRSLNFLEHLYNFVFDAPNSLEMNNRFKRNNVMVSTPIDPNTHELYDTVEGLLPIDIDKLIEANPQCIVNEYIVDNMPREKLKQNSDGTIKLTKDGVPQGVAGCKYFQYRKNNGRTLPYLTHPNCAIGVQGTSSKQYLTSAANLDTAFKWDKFQPSAQAIEDKTISEDKKLYYFSDESMGAKYLNTKVNVASSENANNACLAEWYNRNNPYKSVVKENNDSLDRKHRDTIEFENGVLFLVDKNPKYTLNDGEATIVDSIAKVNTFAGYDNYLKNLDNNVDEENILPQFYAICNVGNSKKNYEIFHREDELCMEIAENDLPEHGFQPSIGYARRDFTTKTDGTNIIYVQKEKDNKLQYWKNLTEHNMAIKKTAYPVYVQKEVDGQLQYLQENGSEDSTFSSQPVYIWKHQDGNPLYWQVIESNNLITDDPTEYPVYVAGLNVVWHDDIKVDHINPNWIYDRYWENDDVLACYEFRYSPAENDIPFDTFLEEARSKIDSNQTYAEVTKTINDKEYTYYELTEIYPHQTYVWKIFDEFSYWYRFADWLTQNNPSLATDEDLESPETYNIKKFSKNPWISSLIGSYGYDEYAKTYTKDSFERRVAKLLEECENFMSLDSFVYHFLFIEKHSMIDNVAKNTFWSTNKDVGYLIWDISKDYDNDTADGNDNTGDLSIEYGREGLDSMIRIGEGAPPHQTFNGAGRNGWFSFIGSLNKLLEEAYQSLRGRMSEDHPWDYLNYVESWQNQLPEICWIYDSFRKYLRPHFLYGNPDKSYDWRLQGGQKKYQRRQYNIYQTKYLDSKYKYDTLRNTAQFRGSYPKGPGIPIKTYSKGYINYRPGDLNGGTVYSERITDLDSVHYFYNKNVSESNDDNQFFNIHNPSLYRQLGQGEMVQCDPDDSASLRDGSFSILNIPQEDTYSFDLFKKLSILYLGPKNATTIKSLQAQKVSFSSGSLLKEFYGKNLKNDDNKDFIIIGLNELNRLQIFDVSNSAFNSGLSFAPGAPLKHIKLTAPKDLTLDSLTQLKTFTIEDFDDLTSLTLNDIDSTLVDGHQQRYSQWLVESARNLDTYSIKNFDWYFSTNTWREYPLITTVDGQKQIAVLEFLLDNNRLHGVSPTTILSGKITIGADAYNDNDTIDIYDKYIIDKKLYTLDLEFEGNDAKLYNFEIQSFDGSPLWSHKFKSLPNNSLDINVFLSKGVTKTGIAAWDNTTLDRPTDLINSYTIDHTQWKLNDEIVDLRDCLEEISEENPNPRIDLSKVINKYKNEISEEDFILQPTYIPTLRNYTITIANSGWDIVQSSYEIPVNSNLDTILNSIVYIPSYIDDPNNPDNNRTMRFWIGLKETPNGKVLDQYTVIGDKVLYAAFSEPINVATVTNNSKYLDYYKKLNCISLNSWTSRRALKFTTNKYFKGKFIMYDPDSNPDPLKPLYSFTFNASAINCYENITHILFTQDCFPQTEIEPFQFASIPLSKLEYFDFDYFQDKYIRFNSNITFSGTVLKPNIEIEGEENYQFELPSSINIGKDPTLSSPSNVFFEAFDPSITEFILNSNLSIPLPEAFFGQNNLGKNNITSLEFGPAASNYYVSNYSSISNLNSSLFGAQNSKYLTKFTYTYNFGDNNDARDAFEDWLRGYFVNTIQPGGLTISNKAYSPTG